MNPLALVHRPKLAAAALLGMSLVTLSLSLAGALHLAPPVDRAGAGELRQMPNVPAPRPAGASTVVAAVERNLFRAERNRAPDRYRLPGEARQTTYDYAPSPAGLVGLQLHGLVTLPGGGGIAALWAPGRPARSVRVGQSYEGYRLARIERGGVVLVGPDTTLTLRLPQSDMATAGQN